MRDLINKLTLLESGGTLSIPAIAELLSPLSTGRIRFEFEQDVNLPLDLGEGPATVTGFRIYDLFGVNENGYLRYHFTSGKSIMFVFNIDPIPIDNLRNTMTIGKTAIKILKQLFGIDDTDYADVTYNKNWNVYIVEITDSSEFLKLIYKAFEYRLATHEDT